MWCFLDFKYPQRRSYLFKYTHASLFFDQHATCMSVSQSKIRTCATLPGQYHHEFLGHFPVELALGIIILAISFIFTYCKELVKRPPITKSNTDITHFFVAADLLCIPIHIDLLGTEHHVDHHLNEAMPEFPLPLSLHPSCCTCCLSCHAAASFYLIALPLLSCL
jgi:hypothetical protein